MSIFEKKRKTCVCAGCKKEVSKQETEWIGAHRFCKACTSPTGVKSVYNHPEKMQNGKRNQITAKTASGLSLFRKSNKHCISDDRYRRILSEFVKRYNDWYLIEDKKPQWSETKDSIQLKDEWNYYAGPDGVLGESITIRLEKTNMSEPETWEPASDWPCTGQHVLIHYTSGEKRPVGWVNYSLDDHRLLKEPFGIPGVWLCMFRYAINRILDENPPAAWSSVSETVPEKMTAEVLPEKAESKSNVFHRLSIQKHGPNHAEKALSLEAYRAVFGAVSDFSLTDDSELELDGEENLHIYVAYKTADGKTLSLFVPSRRPGTPVEIKVSDVSHGMLERVCRAFSQYHKCEFCYELISEEGSRENEPSHVLHLFCRNRK